MSDLPSATQYSVKPKFFICTNPACPLGVPSWKNTGTKSRLKCGTCGKPLRKCNSEPRR